MGENEGLESGEKVNEESRVVELPSQNWDPLQKPKRRKTLIWTGALFGGIVVIALATFGAYRWHQSRIMNQLIQDGQMEIANGNYSNALKDFQSALRYGNNATLQQYLKSASDLVKSEDEYNLGKNAYQRADWNSAIIHLQNVISSDKRNYSEAQQMLSKAKTEVALGRVLQDLSKIMNDKSTFSQDINTLIVPLNKMTYDEYFSPKEVFQQDINSFNGIHSSVQKDIQAIRTDIANLNTDAQLITDNSITPILQSLETNLNNLESDVLDMGSILDVVRTKIQSVLSGGPLQNFNEQSFQWNADKYDLSKLDGLISNDEAKLKAYVSNNGQNSNQSNSSPSN